MAELIQRTDTLNEGREKLNAAIVYAEESRTIAQEGKDNADAAAVEAREAAGEAGVAAERADTAAAELEGLKAEVVAATENADSFIYVREYDPERTYYKNNMATYDGSTYIALEENKGVLPTDSTRWGLVARRGVDGMGAVSAVNNKGPNEDGNVVLTPEEIGAASAQGLDDISQKLSDAEKKIHFNTTFSEDYATLQQAVDNTPPYGLLRVERGIYNTNINIDKPITIDFNNSKLSYGDIGLPIIYAKGYKSEITYRMVSDLKRGDTEIELTSTPIDINIGDYIILRDDSVRPGDSSVDINLEVHKIYDKVGNTLVLDDFVKLPKKVSPINVYKINMLDGVNILNVSFEGVEGVPLISPMILADMTKNLKIENIDSTKSIAPVIKIRKSHKFKVVDFNAESPLKNGSGEGYGIRIDEGSKSGEISKCTGDGLRHLIDCGNAFNVRSYDCDDYNSSTSSYVYSHNGFDTGIEFINCNTFNAQYIGFSGSSQGRHSIFEQSLFDFVLRNSKIQIGSNIRHSKGISFAEIPIKESNFEKVDITFLDGSGSSFIEDSAGLRLTASYNEVSVGNIRIKGALRGIQINTEGNPIDESLLNGFKFNNIVLENCDTGFQFRSVKSIDLREVTFSNVRNLFDFIYHVDPAVNEKLHHLVIKDVLIRGIDVNSITALPSNAYPSTGITGMIDNVIVEGLPKKLKISSGKSISFGEYICFKKDGLLPIYSEGDVSTSTNALPRPIFENESVELVNVGNYPIQVSGGGFVSKAVTIDPNKSARLINIGNRWVSV